MDIEHKILELETELEGLYLEYQKTLANITAEAKKDMRAQAEAAYTEFMRGTVPIRNELSEMREQFDKATALKIVANLAGRGN